MGRIRVTRNSTTNYATTADLVAGQKVTITEAVSNNVMTLTIAATGGGGGGGTPASTVVSEQSPGQSPAVGTSTDYARGDHSHGTPPLPAHSSTTGLGWTSSGHTGNAQSVAVFNGSGAAALSSPTSDGQVLSRQNGVLAWVTLATGLSIFPELTDTRIQQEPVIELGSLFTAASGTL